MGFFHSFRRQATRTTINGQERWVATAMASLLVVVTGAPILGTTTATTSASAKKTTSAEATNKDSSKKQHQQQQHVPKEELFEGQCLKRQMFRPNVPYPAWDYNWDGLETKDTSLEAFRTKSTKSSSNTTRHVILVRHGQYDESSKDDVKRKLTPLGRQQAARTGQRLAKILQGSYTFQQDHEEAVGPCHITGIYSSDMTRAKETAEIIASYLPKTIPYHSPDPLLNEALPSPMIPIRPDISNAEQEIDANHDRIEQAFQKYFFRATPEGDSVTIKETKSKDEEDDSDEDEDNNDDTSSSPRKSDEFEIIVCHGNVIRYMFCRALQIPPEAWLRMSIFNCSLTYIMIRPNGMVSARMLGDIGHLPYEESTFSGYYGFKW